MAALSDWKMSRRRFGQTSRQRLFSVVGLVVCTTALLVHMCSGESSGITADKMKIPSTNHALWGDHRSTEQPDHETDFQTTPFPLYNATTPFLANSVREPVVAEPDGVASSNAEALGLASSASLLAAAALTEKRREIASQKRRAKRRTGMAAGAGALSLVSALSSAGAWRRWQKLQGIPVETDSVDGLTKWNNVVRRWGWSANVLLVGAILFFGLALGAGLAAHKARKKHDFKSEPDFLLRASGKDMRDVSPDDGETANTSHENNLLPQREKNTMSNDDSSSSSSSSSDSSSDSSSEFETRVA